MISKSIPARIAILLGLAFLAAIATTLLGSALFGVDDAIAGTYTVSACEAAPGNANHSWWQHADSLFYVTTGCPNGPDGQRQGMLAMVGLNVQLGNIAQYQQAFTRFDAPAGTTIANAWLNYDGTAYPSVGWTSILASSDNGYQGGPIASGNPHFNYLDGCTAMSFCGAYGNGTSHFFSFPGGTTSIQGLIFCNPTPTNYGWCPTGQNGAAVAIHGAQVTLEDDNGPSITNPQGLYNNSGWVHGTQHLGYDASDASGIKIARIEADPGGAHGFGWPVDDARGCDYTYAVPCPQAGTSADFNTANLSDGVHTLRYAAMDTAGNWYSLPDHTIRVDNHTPGRPSLSLEGGDGWRTTPSFSLDWTNPDGQVAPITVQHWRICPADGNGCWTRDTSVGSGSSNAAVTLTDSFGITQPGDYTVRMWLEDEAGNTTSDEASDAIHLKWDNVPPGSADPAKANGWLNAQEAASYPQWVQLTTNGTIPVSGITGYAVTSDGSDPGTTINAPGDQNGVNYLVSNLPEGHNTIKARAISGAGLASTTVKSVDVPVDKTPPTVAAQAAPDPTVWQNHDVAVTVIGTDQADLSGMGGAPVGQPVTSGAYIDYSIDGGPDQQIRGSTANIVVTGDGVHHVSYRAHDLAGNTSARESVDVRVDKTAPELVVFENSDPNAPTRLSVAASDRTSGVADGGVIQMRLIAPSAAKQATRYQRASHCTYTARSRRCAAVMHYVKRVLERTALSDWQSLPTGRNGDHFVADLTPALVPQAGLYEFRALVQDRAGNEAIGSTLRDGSPAERFVNPGVLNGQNDATGNNGSGGAGGRRVHCFGCPSYATATLSTKLAAGLVAPRAPKKNQKRPALCKRTSSHKRVCRSAHTAGRRPRRPPRGRRSPHATSSESLVPARLVPFGKTAVAKGTLTYEDGRPIASAWVDVYAKLNAAGNQYEHVAAVETDAHGAFTYKAAAGPSRSLGFRYDGNQTDKAAEASVTLRVPAASTIKLNRKRLHVGQSVTLRGRLARLDAPLPSSGKLIVLEAFDRRRWRKFATVRANRAGSWRYRYRFVATRGTATYPMRAVIERESSYAFETGTTKPVKVTVRGR